LKLRNRCLKASNPRPHCCQRRSCWTSSPPAASYGPIVASTIRIKSVTRTSSTPWPTTPPCPTLATRTSTAWPSSRFDTELWALSKRRDEKRSTGAGPADHGRLRRCQASGSGLDQLEPLGRDCEDLRVPSRCSLMRRSTTILPFFGVHPLLGEQLRRDSLVRTGSRHRDLSSPIDE